MARDVAQRRRQYGYGFAGETSAADQQASLAALISLAQGLDQGGIGGCAGQVDDRFRGPARLIGDAPDPQISKWTLQHHKL
jgi:hypothetical protein